MANPNAPLEGSGRRIIYVIDPDNQGTAYLPVATGAIDMGVDNTRGGVLGALPWSLVSGSVPAKHHAPDTFKPFTLTTLTTEQVIWDPASGKKFRVLGIHVKATVECKLNLLDGTGGSTIVTIGAGDSMPVTIDLGPIGILSGAANANLYITSSASADVVGTVWGTED